MMKKRKTASADASTDAPLPDESSLVAWEQNPQAQALRVDLQGGVFFVLPYSHFGFAHFAREANHETLRVSFATHEVRVSGRNLRELGLALQKLTVDWIREMPARYAALPEKGCVLIERIEITEASEGGPPPAECASCSGGGNSTGETLPAKRVGSSRGSCE